jgi:heat shock protein HslJ
MKQILIILMVFIIVSCASQKKVTNSPYVIWVKGIKVDCTGVGPMKCMQVQKNDIIEPGKWQNFYTEIEGFQFQSGDLCKLLVSEEKPDKSQVPADGSSIKYKMVELLEKKPDPIFELHDIWALEAIEGAPIQSPGNNTVLITPSIEINLTEMKIMGNDGCNQFFGPIKNIEEGIIEFGNMAGTMKMCINMEIPDSFNKAMTQVKKYRRDGLKLYFLDEAGTELLMFKKVD